MKADPALSFASATLALAQALAGDDKGAVATLNALGDKAEGVVPAQLARFWLVTRYQSNEAGVALLEQYEKKAPWNLLYRGYRAEALGVLGRTDAAQQVWSELVELMPASPWAIDGLSHAQARAGRLEEAVATAKKAVALAPGSVDAALQLASRQVDLRQLDDATATLTPLADAKDARAEVLLRLGWVQWLQGKVDPAAALFTRARAAATSAAEWRTRGRASYNLALVEAKRGKPEAVQAALKEAALAGFTPKTVDPSLTAALKTLEGKLPPPPPTPTEWNLWPVSAAGDVQVAAAKAKAPEGFERQKLKEGE